MHKAVLFDLDGVVTDTAELHYQAWQALSDRHGYRFDRAINEQLRGVSRSASLRIILDGEPVPDGQFAAMLEEKNAAYIELLDSLGPDDVLPGVLPLLDALRALDVRTSIASASRNARTILNKLGLTARFDGIADGYSVERSKPAPDVFVHAAGQLGCICSECVVVEDAVAGIEAGKSAGMKTVGIGAHVASAEPDILLNQTAELSTEILA